MEKNPVTLSKAIKFVKTSLANKKAIFGSTKNSLAQRQVTFSDTEGTNSKEKAKLSFSCCLTYCNCRLAVTGSGFLLNLRFIS
jgi:hypothetical protein